MGLIHDATGEDLERASEGGGVEWGPSIYICLSKEKETETETEKEKEPGCACRERAHACVVVLLYLPP